MNVNQLTQGFNTQPPEGGWTATRCWQTLTGCFNTQPPEGGWTFTNPTNGGSSVSTHSRLKAAGFPPFDIASMTEVSTHSRLKAAGCCFGLFGFIRIVSTHSRLKAAGKHTAAQMRATAFQHTAA